MEHDEMSLAENFAGSNNDDDDDIDSDLEDKLYAAVFHSNDISSKADPEVLGYNDFTTRVITDVVSAWKNIPSDVAEVSPRSDARRSTVDDDDNRIERPNAEESEVLRLAVAGRYETFVSRNRNHCDRKEAGKGRKIHRDADRVEKWDSENHGNAETPVVQTDKEIIPGADTPRRKNTLDNRETSDNGKKSSRTKTMKRQKNSPIKTSLRFEDSATFDNTPPKSPRRTDNADGTDAQGRIHAQEDLAIIAPPEGFGNEPSEVKSEEEGEKDRSIEKEGRISLSEDKISDVEEGQDRPASIKPEEEIEREETAEKEFSGKERVEEIEEVKPEDEAERIQPVALNSSSDSSSSDSSSTDSSPTFSVQRAAQKLETNLPDRTQSRDVIMIEDSEDSIFEIPVPPKPRPPTINLEDSESSASSDSESSSDTETMSPQKLVESYKMAVSESSRSLKAKENLETPVKNKAGQRQIFNSADNSSSDSDDSMTESEEENWGIIAGSQINKDRPSPSAARIIYGLDAIEEPRSAGSPNTGAGDKGGNPASKEPETRVESSSSFPETPKKLYSDISSNNSSIAGERLDGRSPSGEKLPENTEKQVEPANSGNTADNTLIINVGSFEEHSQPARTPENRKRSMLDSGKKSKHHNSPKKAKSSEDSPLPGSSDKSRRENKENKDRKRNCAADYFFKPMTNEMENYYNKSWGGENFDIDDIQSGMPRDPRQWAILNEDLLGHQQRRSRYWTESKCRNCNHTGHHIADCPEKRKLPSCHMCGTQGHREPRCPHKMCLGCGKKQKTYMQVCNGCRRAWCNGCQSYGHVEDSCPDLWRRYHLTTSFRNVNTELNVADVMKPPHMLSCCNCARRGHDSTTCENYRWSRHFPTPAFVTNYSSGPAYAEDIVFGDVNDSSETREGTETERSSAPCTSSSSNEGKRRRSNADNPEKENPEPEISHAEAPNEVETAERPIEQSKERSKSHQEKGQNSESRKGGEILFSHKSPLVDAEFERAANFGKHTVALTRAQCKVLVDSDLSREFLMNLISQFPIKIEIKHCTDGNAKMLIKSTTDLHSPIQLTIMDWLKWPAEERSRFVNLNLPTTKDELIRLLSDKLEELKQDLGDPMVLNNAVISLKSELKRLQRQSESGQKHSTCSKRARVVEELAKSQCKLNMILMGQTNVKSSKFLRATLIELQKPGSSSYINATTYLQIVHHYNIIFAAYTAENVPSLLNNYYQKYSMKGVNKARKDTVYNNFIKALNSPTLAGSNVSPAAKARRQRVPKDRGSGGSAFNGSPHYNRVESRFRTPERGFDVPNPSYGPSLPPAEPVPLMYDLDRLENNYYNSRYNFGDNSGSRRHRRGEKNREQEDYIALDGRSMQNNHYNVEKDLDNVVAGDFSRRSKGRHRSRSTPRIGGSDTAENGFPNYAEGNTQGELSPGRNKWHDNYVPRNTSLRDIFLYDNQPERSSHPSFTGDSNTSDVFPWVDIERRDRQDGNGPSTSTCTSTSVLNSNNFNNKRNSIPNVVDQPRSNGNKNKKKKKNKGSKLSPYLQKRAGKNIAKYIDLGIPRITQAAKELQQKITNKEVTLQCVQQFEGLVKRKLKRKDYLL